jgi:hypothetical protein
MNICNCNTCSGGIEFEDSQTGSTVQCPHCGIETILFIPKSPPTNIKPILKPIENFKPHQELRDDNEIYIEDRLELAATLIFLIGIAAFAISIVLAFTDTNRQTQWFILGFVSAFQGWVVSLIFKGFAEVIRLLRKK